MKKLAFNKKINKILTGFSEELILYETNSKKWDVYLSNN